MVKKLNIKRRFSLKDVGEGWEECYIDFRPFTYADLKKLSQIKDDDVDSIDVVVQVLEEHFVGGRLLEVGQDQPVDMTRDDVQALPADIINDLIQEATGQVPKG